MNTKFIYIVFRHLNRMEFSDSVSDCFFVKSVLVSVLTLLTNVTWF